MQHKAMKLSHCITICLSPAELGATELLFYRTLSFVLIENLHIKIITSFQQLSE